MAKSLDKHIRFVATEVGTAIEFGVLSCGASTSRLLDECHYIIVQANLDEPDEWGVYFEIDDQINGGYQRLQKVQLVDSRLVLSLNQGTDWYPELEQITVDLSKVDTAEVESLRAALDSCLEQCDLKVEVTAAG